MNYETEKTFQHSTFNIQHSTFNIQPSTFNLQHSTFNLQPSTFNIQPSTFNLQHSTFRVASFISFEGVLTNRKLLFSAFQLFPKVFDLGVSLFWRKLTSSF